jgi:hypothetical protein
MKEHGSSTTSNSPNHSFSNTVLVFRSNTTEIQTLIEKLTRRFELRCGIDSIVPVIFFYFDIIFIRQFFKSMLSSKGLIGASRAMQGNMNFIRCMVGKESAGMIEFLRWTHLRTGILPGALLSNWSVEMQSPG